MKILIANVHFSPDSFGGATVIAEETARRLRERGHDIVVFTTTADYRMADHQLFRYESGGIPVVAIKVPPDRTTDSEYNSQAVTDRFSQVLDAVAPDVVHLHALQALGVGLAAAAQQRGIPTVATLHDAWWLCERQFMVRQTGEYCGQMAIDPVVCATCVPDPARAARRNRHSLELLNRCARVLAPSRFWRDLLVASGVSDDIAQVNANGVRRPAPGWQRPPREPGPARIGYVGALSKVKGYPQLIEALVAMKRSDYELLVVDSFANLGGASMTNADWQVPGLVRVIPGYTADTTDEFFGGLDALVFPSQWKESYGLTVREAALRGVWPILSDGGGTAEHIHSGRNGTVYDRAGGVPALAAALDDYLDRFQELRVDPAANEGIPTYAEQVAELEQILREVTSPTGS